jgi:predicted transcriptional regulator of viral defense system
VGVARDRLWEMAVDQHGYVTTAQAESEGISRHALAMLARRGRLTHAAYGVYRVNHVPTTEFDPFALAVLWTGAPEACLSHGSALACYEISDINPTRTHLTVGRRRRIRRSGGDGYAVHYEDLAPNQVGWWNEVPAVTAATAVEQCIQDGTPRYLLRQALDRGRQDGRLTREEAEKLDMMLEARGG